MKKDITYTGYSATPSDYDCADGSLATAINAVPENGSMRPILPPSTLISLENGKKVIYIHKNTGYENFIYEYNGLVRFISADGQTEKEVVCYENNEERTDIIAVGNTLIISTNQNLRYVLYDKDKKAYTYLGNQLPELNMRFALEGEIRSADHQTQLTFSEYTSNEETFKMIESQELSLARIGDEQGNYSAVFTPKYAIEVGVEYAFAIRIGDANSYFWIYGATNETSEWELITSGWANGWKVKGKAKKAYTSLKCVVKYGFSYNNTTAMFKIYKGFTIPAEDGGAKKIEYNGDNYAAVMAAVNKFVSQNSIDDDCFVYPFFVRYALRLTDGTYGRISAPTLLVPNSGYAPYVSFQDRPVTDKCDTLSLYAFFARLQYAFLNTIDEKWKDIVAGVDIFVTQQAYPYNQGDAFDADTNRFEYAYINSTVNEIADIDYGYFLPANFPDLGYDYVYNKFDLFGVANYVYGFGKITESRKWWGIVKIAHADDQMEQLQKLSNFYLIHSFTREEITSSVDAKTGEVSYAPLNIKKGNLKNLVNRKSLTDDTLSQCRFLDAHLVNYNSRLHLFNFSLQHPAPFTPVAQNGYQSPYFYNDSSGTKLRRNNVSFGTLHSVHVYIRTTQGERIVKHEVPSSKAYKEYAVYCPWFFYPHNQAYKAVLTYKSTSTKTLDDGTTEEVASYYYVFLNLKQHELLNGAYYMNDDLGEPDFYAFNGPVTEPYTATVNDISTYPASVLQSQATMPFNFSDTMLNTLPVARIDYMSSAAKALSQGQFGQFPLYAFTTEGIWALEVSSTGTYTARQPITRDVAISSTGITQLDSAVVFAANRGIMLLSGSESTCISDILQESTLFKPLTLPIAEKLLKLSGLTADNISFIPFIDYIQHCRILYDYTHQRIIVYNPGCRYAYVYSLKSKAWGMMASDIAYALNSYPDAIAVTSANSVINLSQDDTTATQTNMLIFTRPFKLDEPNTLKTIDTIIQRGVLERNHAQQVLYGSRDLIHWHIVWSSTDIYLRGFRGTPYKYFRLAILCQLTADESLSGCTVQYTLRYDNKPR